jgi:structural maintenance of chromosome 2
MSGGAAPSGSGILARAQELREAGGRVVKARARLEALEREQVARRTTREAWRARRRELEIKEHELRLLQEQVGSSNAARVRFFFSFSRFAAFVEEINKCVGRDSSDRA